MTDSASRLRASSFMDVAQVAAMASSDALGCGYDTLAALDKAWVLYRMHFKFLRPVLWKERVTVSTWHRGLQDLVFLRDCVLKGQDGLPSVISTASWIVFDTQKRRYVPQDELPSCVSPDPQCSDALFEVPAPKVNFPRQARLLPSCERVVAYSDVDLLGHTNNARYVAWAMDALDPDFVSAHPVKEVTLNFNRETRPGERVVMRLGEMPDGAFYAEGIVEGRQAFSARLLF